MFNPFKLLTGGIVSSLENIALEFIETDKESAEAKAILAKAIDPNGKMRRDLSRFACRAYGGYLISMVAMGFMVAFDVGNTDGAVKAMEMMKELFLPITTAWGTIVGCSFGVNGINSSQGK